MPLLHLAVIFISVVAPIPAAAYTDTGIPLWTNRYNGPGNGADYAIAIAVVANGNVYVTGQSTSDGSGSGDDFATIAYSSVGLPLWTNRYNGPGNGSDYPTALTVDASGNAFVSGVSKRVDLNSDYATVKYSSAGIPLWTNRYDYGSDFSTAVTVDTNGYVYVTGQSSGGVNGDDYATIKYSGAGVPLWTNRYNGPANSGDGASAIAVDASGNAYVTGTSTGISSDLDYTTIKYSNMGVPLWTNRYNGSANGVDVASAIGVDASENVYVTGRSAGSGSGDDFVTIKYSNNGQQLWALRHNGQGNGTDDASALAMDTNGNVIITGMSEGSSSGFDYTTIKYSGAGVPSWTNRYNGWLNGIDHSYALVVDVTGNVYVTGYSDSNTFPSYRDYATIKYSGAGVPLWTNRYNGPGMKHDQAVALAVDAIGNVFVTGDSAGTSSGYDFATVKYAGVPLTPPIITNTVLASTTLVFGGIGGSASGTYYVLASSNVTVRMTNWTRTATNSFSPGGSFSVTNTLNPTWPRQFYRIEVP